MSVDALRRWCLPSTPPPRRLEEAEECVAVLHILLKELHSVAQQEGAVSFLEKHGTTLQMMSARLTDVFLAADSGEGAARYAVLEAARVVEFNADKLYEWARQVANNTGQAPQPATASGPITGLHGSMMAAGVPGGVPGGVPNEMIGDLPIGGTAGGSLGAGITRLPGDTALGGVAQSRALGGAGSLASAAAAATATIPSTSEALLREVASSPLAAVGLAPPAQQAAPAAAQHAGGQGVHPVLTSLASTSAAPPPAPAPSRPAPGDPAPSSRPPPAAEPSAPTNPGALCSSPQEWAAHDPDGWASAQLDAVEENVVLARRAVLQVRKEMCEALLDKGLRHATPGSVHSARGAPGAGDKAVLCQWGARARQVMRTLSELEGYMETTGAGEHGPEHARRRQVINQVLKDDFEEPSRVLHATTMLWQALVALGCVAS